MPDLLLLPPVGETVAPDNMGFYRSVLETLNAAAVPYMVGGAYAFNFYTGVNRQTRDLDIFIRRQDYLEVSEALLKAGYRTELTFRHWLAKVYNDGTYIDIIFSSGNGVARVDQAWLDYAVPAQVADIDVMLCPVEEMIWSKAFIMERERFDGADVAHLLRARADRMDWRRLLRRFEPHWRVLLCHLTLFGFIYPDHRDLVPAKLMDMLLRRLRRETHAKPPARKICQGTLLSREQYLMDIEQWHYLDARIDPLGNMTENETATWTEAIPDRRNAL
ncbi:MAG: nucleotidyltransferase [Noviherbaspirillum sp.]